MPLVVKFFRDLGAFKLAAAIAGALLLFFAMGLLLYKANSSQMSILYSGLDMDDSNKIIQELENRGINYSVFGDGSIIKVDESEVFKVRAQMAQAGLPNSDRLVGYGIFDQNQETLGTTQFLQNVRMLRALEGELSRTISSFEQIEWARVHLVIPHRELFAKEQQEPKASVVVTLKKSAVLSKIEVDGISHLVSTAVDGLVPKNITIVDTKGKPLKLGGTDDDYASIGAGEDARRAYEMSLAKSVEELLAKSLGHSRVKVHVTAEVNRDKIVTNSKIYDPDGVALRSSQSVEEYDRGAAENSENGDLSALNNLPGMDGQSNDNASIHNKNDETKNYEVSEVVKNHIEEPGNIRRLFVAVLVDGSYKQNPLTSTMEYYPRSPEEMSKIEGIVKVAVGYQEERNDKVEIVNMRFFEEMMPEPKKEESVWVYQELPRIIKITIIALSIVLISIFVIRPMLSKIFDTRNQGLGIAQNEEIGGSFYAGSDDLKSNAANEQVKKAHEVAATYPRESAVVLREWIKN